MRLVSQNGNVDIPYDKATLLHAQGDVMARVGDKEYILGVYSSMEKSYRVMEMVREEYLETVYDYRTRPKVFQFPKDEEVEV
jgi:hypothetical protein